MNMSLKQRRIVVAVSTVAITAVYWFVALWHENKGEFSKDLVVFHHLFGASFVDNPWIDFWQYIYQFGVTVLLFVAVPFLISRYWLNIRFSDLGLKFTYHKEAIILCAVVYPVVLASTYFSAQEPVIAAEYPLTKLAGTSWAVFAGYQFLYMFYFIAYEVFYRGYLQFGLKSENASRNELMYIILFQTVLTTLFHIGKPMPEITMAALFGPVFGVVAFRYGNIWYGMGIHFLMNVFIDYFSLKGWAMLPQSWF
jgi:membrane protease YdiL (CAAX protease family)